MTAVIPAKSTSGQAPDAQDSAALLYAYTVRDVPAFEAAYKAHLAWHAEKQDHLVWYGWYVVAGARTGQFVDGTFGAPWPAIDRRPDLAGDAAHFQEHVAPHARATLYDGHVLWREVSTVTPLEDRQPSRVLDVFFVEVSQAMAASFETGLVSAARRGTGSLRWTWYRTLLGGIAQSYVVLVPRDAWAGLEGRGSTLSDFAAAAYGAERSEMDKVFQAVTQVRSETWSYRVDLSYFPS